MRQVLLRREYENTALPLTTVCSRWSRGVYRRAARPVEPSVSDARGPLVRSVETVQTFLKPAQVDELVALYAAGATLVELAERFGVYSRTVARHLARRSVPTRRRGLTPEQVVEARVLYEEGGMTQAEIAARLGAAQTTVGDALRRAGVAVRPRGRRRGRTASA